MRPSENSTMSTNSRGRHTTFSGSTTAVPARFLTFLLALVGGLAPLGQTHAAIDDPISLMPESSVVYLEISRPQEVLDRLTSKSLYEHIQALPGVDEYYKSDEYSKARLAIALLEAGIGRTWIQAIKDLAGESIHFGFDPASGTAVLVIRGQSKDFADKLNQSLVTLASQAAAQQGKPSQVQSVVHNGIQAWMVAPGEIHAILGNLIVMGNKPEVVQGAIDKFQGTGGPTRSLLDAPEFQTVRRQMDADQVGWAYLKWAAIRSESNIDKALHDRSTNVLLEVLTGGVLDTLRDAPYVTAALRWKGNRLSLNLEVPRDATKVAAARQWFFASSGGQADLNPPNTIGTFTLDRDLAGMWLAREDLFTEQVLAGFAQADTQFGLFFSNRDFATEVLAELEPEMQVVVTRQQFGSGPAVPNIKLPAFALVMKMKRPEVIGKHLLIAYQKIVGLVNISGGQEGQPALLLGSEAYQGATISKATYEPEIIATNDTGPINYNFSPSCAQVGKYFIVGSSLDIVRSLVDNLQKGSSTDPSQASQITRLDASGEEAALALEANQEMLISQTMLRQGQGRPEAERAIGAILKLVRMADHAGLRLSAKPASMSLELFLDSDPTLFARP